MRMWVLKLRLSQKSLTEVQCYMIFNLFPSQRTPNRLPADHSNNIKQVAFISTQQNTQSRSRSTKEEKFDAYISIDK